MDDANRSKQFISCTQCRSRKVKCPGERPHCSSCAKKDLDCHYDSVRKRRGPDKEPGGRLKPRGTFVNQFLINTRPFHPVPSIAPQVNKRPSDAAAYGAHYGCPKRDITPQSHQGRGSGSLLDKKSDNLLVPSLAHSVFDSWWSLLFENLPEEQVVEHCRQFLEDLDIWYNFFHRGRFFQAFFARGMGPHVIFAILAHTTFLRDGTSRTGQLRALHFAQEARKMLDYCLDIGVQDCTLMYTALLLVAFEFQPHIHQNLARATAALGYMETCSRACNVAWAQTLSEPVSDCWTSETRTIDNPSATRTIKQEEVRRMCWTLSQMAAYSTLWRHLSDQQALLLPTADPTKFSTLFPLDPVKVDEQEHVYSWSLCHRSICLWHMSVNGDLDDLQRLAVVQEARGIVRKFEAHVSDVQRKAWLWHAKDWSLAALAHLGDLDHSSTAAWFRTHTTTLLNHDEPNVKKSPLNSWWLLMVAFTGLRLLEQVPERHPDGATLLTRLVIALEKLTTVWPCSNLEHGVEVLKRRYESIVSQR